MSSDKDKKNTQRVQLLIAAVIGLLGVVVISVIGGFTGIKVDLGIVKLDLSKSNPTNTTPVMTAAPSSNPSVTNSITSSVGGNFSTTVTLIPTVGAVSTLPPRLPFVSILFEDNFSNGLRAEWTILDSKKWVRTDSGLQPVGNGKDIGELLIGYDSWQNYRVEVSNYNFDTLELFLYTKDISKSPLSQAKTYIKVFANGGIDDPTKKCIITGLTVVKDDKFVDNVYSPEVTFCDNSKKSETQSLIVEIRGNQLTILQANTPHNSIFLHRLPAGFEGGKVGVRTKSLNSIRIAKVI